MAASTTAPITTAPAGTHVLFCGGGTGGHVLPGLAVVAALRQRGVATISWIGDPQRIEAKLVPAANIPLLPLGINRPRKTSPGWWLHLLGTLWGVHRQLRRQRPQAIVALGGYAALVPGLLARLHRIPLVVMEQNAKAGKTNRLGNPVRPIAPKARGRGTDLTVLVVGGSLAAKSLNDLLIGAAADLALIPGLRLIHLAGDQDRQRCADAFTAAGLDAEVHGFVHDMPALYDRVDLVIGRAGATTVAELCCAGLGAVYIPLPWAADDHQTSNAQAVARVGGAVVLPQVSTTPADLAKVIGGLVGNRFQVQAMGAAACELARPDAADQVALVVLGLITGQPVAPTTVAAGADGKAA